MADQHGRKPVRQDYILRVRYQNTLPPPPFEPKLLKLPISLSQFTSASYLSTLIQEQPQKVDIDAELGMPIDLTLIPGIYEGDETLMYPPAIPEKLDPKDQALLKGTTDGQGAKLAAESAFLRRTQYISSELATSSKKKQLEADRVRRMKDALKVELDPAEQLLAIEKTFETARCPLSDLKHPAKRGLKAMQSWTVMPDSERFDQQCVNAKFPSNPAPRTKSNAAAEDEDPRLQVCCMIPRIVDDTIDAPENDYIAYFMTDEKTAKDLDHHNTTGEGDGNVSRYRFVREYDAKQDEVAAEWVIKFQEEDAVYMELGARMNMRGRRRGTQVTSANEVVELTLRSLNDAEKDEQNRIRNPMAYEQSNATGVAEEQVETEELSQQTTQQHTPQDTANGDGEDQMELDE